MTKLLPCPFCASDAPEFQPSLIMESCWYVMCNDCGAMSMRCLDEHDAVNKWNMRKQSIIENPESRMKWIKLADEKPPKHGRYIVYVPYSTISWIGVSSYREGRFEDKFDDEFATHYMLLPKPPEE